MTVPNPSWSDEQQAIGKGRKPPIVERIPPPSTVSAVPGAVITPPAPAVLVDDQPPAKTPRASVQIDPELPKQSDSDRPDESFLTRETVDMMLAASSTHPGGALFPTTLTRADIAVATDADERGRVIDR